MKKTVERIRALQSRSPQIKGVCGDGDVIVQCAWQWAFVFGYDASWVIEMCSIRLRDGTRKMLIQDHYPIPVRHFPKRVHRIFVLKSRNFQGVSSAKKQRYVTNCNPTFLQYLARRRRNCAPGNVTQGGGGAGLVGLPHDKQICS